MFNSNKHLNGFEDKVLLSNLNPQHKSIKGKDQICFLNYDLKNKLDAFSEKANNPLSFENELYIEAEEVISLNEISFPSKSSTGSDFINIKPTITKDKYLEKVNLLKQHIQKGDIYEINFCITFEAFDVKINPLQLYQRLNAISNAPFSAFVKLNKRYIICSSPELFLSKRASTLITKPIKGTAKRGLSEQDDIVIKLKLQNDLKERTENVMIVDVARNDLSRIATVGSVAVDKLCDIESYQQVHQMVSSISCKTEQNIMFEDIITATYPMASMTGAPKIRAMQLIDEYELYNRNVYSGALGYINQNGDFDLNVLIRSIFYNEEKKYLSFTVGSAITMMCNPEDEYNECLLKAKALMSILEKD